MKNRRDATRSGRPTPVCSLERTGRPRRTSDRPPTRNLSKTGILHQEPAGGAILERESARSSRQKEQAPNRQRAQNRALSISSRPRGNNRGQWDIAPATHDKATTGGIDSLYPVLAQVSLNAPTTMITIGATIAATRKKPALSPLPSVIERRERRRPPQQQPVAKYSVVPGSSSVPTPVEPTFAPPPT